MLAVRSASMERDIVCSSSGVESQGYSHPSSAKDDWYEGHESALAAGHAAASPIVIADRDLQS